jgi:hypothetical protein
MSDVEKGARPAAAPVDEDPNAVVVCSSPPCFMHELDPSYLGYLGQEEVSALLGAVLAAEWGTAAPTDEARLRAALGRHLEASDGGRPDHVQGEPPRPGPDGLSRVIREALPRVHDGALRRDLGEVLGALARGAPRPSGPQEGG